MQLGVDRFIPARAGNAESVKTASTVVTVHPRASGERATVAATFADTVGSSPRERGTPTRANCAIGGSPVHPRASGERCAPASVRYPAAWFIPARAGNAPAGWSASGAIPVHPRASGERAPMSRRDCVATGSSPRERGTHARPVRRAAARRFIPARAGNASVRSGPHVWNSVHPRASGERRISPPPPPCPIQTPQRSVPESPLARPLAGR